MKRIKKLLLWLKRSFEYKGKASARKLTTFTSFSMLCLGYLDHLNSGQIIQKEFIYLFSIITLIGLGYMTAENIVDIVKGRFSGQQIFDYGQEIYNNSHGVDNPDAGFRMPNTENGSTDV